MTRFFLTIFAVVTLAASAAPSDFVQINLPTQATINKIDFESSEQGWIATSTGEVFLTIDGGKTWRGRQVTQRAIRDIHIRGRIGILVGERGMIMRSLDRGGNWVDVSENIKYDFVGVGIVNDTSAVVCGNDLNSISKTKGVLFQTFDRGMTWRKYSTEFLGNGYTDVVVQPPRKVYLLASKRAFHSINAGIRYFRGQYGGSRLGFGSDFIDDWGFMVGSKGLFCETTDHGRNWEEVDVQITKDLYAVEMFDKFSGVAVGQDGLVVYFSESGKKFTVSSCGHQADLKTVCITADKIFCGGTGGTLLVRPRGETAGE